jgi:glycerol-3-phosphate dehydrogenase (NAD(P)+)
LVRRTARIGVIGGGAFGTAMACVLRRSRHDVTLWAREAEVVAAISGEHLNPRFLPGVKLDAAIAATGDLPAAARGRDFLVLAVPAQHMREVARALREALARGTPVISCSKGIERETCALMPEVLAETLPGSAVAVLSGPSFAAEIAAGLPCGVALACADLQLARSLARELADASFCVHPTADVAGVALGGVMKNVVAIAAGAAAGRRLGENARATVVALGLAETLRLGVAMGARAETFAGLAGAGDMMLTAASLQSRNTSLGVALGEGRSPQEVLAARLQVTEGAQSAPAVVALARRLGVAMPVAEAVDAVLAGRASVDAAIEDLVARAR